VTATPSITITVPGTSTDTSTATPSPSLTRSSTATPSGTQTSTGTQTGSATQTGTATQTRTVTETSTVTITVPGTSTDTSTVSVTPTLTATPTRTITTLDTATDTGTMTATATASPSATATGTDPFTPSDTASSTGTRTVTASPSATATRTDGPSPSSTASATPSPSTTPTLTETRTSTESPTATLSPTRSFSATASPSLTPTMTRTPTQAPRPMPYQMTVAAYNSAGELVRLIYQGAASAQPVALQLHGGNGQPVSLDLPGPLADGSTSLLWSGDNASGQSLSSGTYIIKVQTLDPFGDVQTLQGTVQMLAVGAPAQLALYNSAGELVRHWDLQALGFDAVDLGHASASEVELKGLQGAVLALPFDGLNDAGQPLAGGTYSLILRQNGAGKPPTIVRSITIIPSAGSDPLADLAPEQNPVPPGQERLILRYTPMAGVSLQGALYNLAGERVALADASQAGRLSVPLGGAASGVYFLSVEASGSGTRSQRRTLKIAVTR
jgi:hypothetical protein